MMKEQTDLLVLVEATTGFGDVIWLLFPLFAQVGDGHIRRTCIKGEMTMTEVEVTP